MAPTTFCFVLSLFIAGVSSNCLDSWTPFNGWCYHLFRSKKSWPLAKFECEKHDAYLATLETQQDNVDIVHLMTLLNGKSTDRIWIGLTDVQHEDRWVWEYYHRNVTYLNWGTGEPNQKPGESEQDCVLIVGLSNYEWVDYECSRAEWYLCERSQAAT